MDSPYQSPIESSPPQEPGVKRPSYWSTAGFFIGIGLAITSVILALVTGPLSFVFVPSSLVLGLTAAIVFGVTNQKFGYVSGFLAGLLICIGLGILAIIIMCGHMSAHAP
jgi:hypothetical protein